MNWPGNIGVAVILIALLVGQVMSTECDETVFTIDGRCNNLENPTLGMPDTVYVRHEPVAYADGLKEKRDGPNERTISQALSKDDKTFGNSHLLTLLHTFFGQFLAHDIASTKTVAAVAGSTAHLTNIEIEDPDDPLYALSKQDPPAMQVSLSLMQTDEFGIGHPINGITHFIDLSSAYGSHSDLLNKLRAHKGGRMITTDYQLDGRELGFKSIELFDQLPNENRIGVEAEAHLRRFVPPQERLLAGDLRIIENPQLGAYHLVFVREHNRYASKFAEEHPDWTDEQLFEAARKWTVATYQNIVLYEFVRAVVGPVLFTSIEQYRGYDSSVDPRMDVSFISSAIRFGHSMLPDEIPILDMYENEMIGVLPIIGLFHGKFGPLSANLLTRGQANLMYSLYMFGAREADEKASDAMRSFRDPFDVLAANLVRERLHGLPAYNDLRKARHPGREAADIYQQQGCAVQYEQATEDDPLGCFMSITHDMDKALLLQQVYGKVKFVDGFMGMQMEHRPPGSTLGMTQASIVVDQFMRSRDGDRWWFENTDNGLFTPEEVETIKARRLADVLSDNYGIPREKLGDYVFVNSKSGSL